MKGPDMKQRVVKTSIILLAVVALLIMGSLAVETVASRRTLATYPPRGEFVNVGGQQMHVICQGEGSPTLVMQAGIGGGAIDWLPVMEDLAGSVRVCAFDRLGQDWSDAASDLSGLRTLADAADELHAAIQALGIEQPVVVGHSLGGAVVQIYASRYDVSGVVLVDGLSADVADEVARRLGVYQKLNWAARLGLLRPLGGLFADDAYPEALRAEMRGLRSQSATLINMADEGAAAATVADELRAAEAAMDAPLLIIAAGENGLPEGEQFLTALNNLHQRHPNSSFTLIPHASHYVIASHPQEIATMILNWLNSNVSG